MRSAGVFILALVASAIAGVLVYAAASFLPDWDDPAGHGLGEVFRGLLTLGYVLLGAILYGIAVWRLDRERRLRRVLYVLFLVPLLIVALGALDNGIGAINWLHESVGMVQMFTPLWTVALVQWLILHIYFSRPTLFAKAASR
jgi:cell division protein FtsW (lipid II flippase)